MYNITPTFALGLESLDFQYCSALASTLHSPVTRDNMQNTLAISAPGNDTMKAGTQLFYSNVVVETQSSSVNMLSAIKFGL